MKHAYLIMAHNDFSLFEKLLTLLDDSRNDIFVHIDKKVKDFDFAYYERIVQHAKLYYTPRIDVRWGDLTVVECELTLLKAATKHGHYDYYHLLSGVDLPLKSQDEIHQFFKANAGREFINFSSRVAAIAARERILRYYYMKNSRPNNFSGTICNLFSRIFVNLQRIFHFKRALPKNVTVWKGSNWFSVTHDLAEYVVGKEDFIYNNFKYTSCSDELFLQTIVYDSEFKERLYKPHNGVDDNESEAYVRAIDWQRGIPYTYRLEDFDALINSGLLFARKFSSSVDVAIIDKLYLHINPKNEKRENSSINN